MNFETIGKSFYSNHKDGKNYVIDNSKEWNDLWVLLNVGIGPTDVPVPPLPDVDFNKNMIVAVFMGEQATGGYSIEIAKIVENQNNNVEVYVKEKSPGAGCMVTKALTQPSHIIKVPNINKEFIFKVNKETVNC